MNWDVWSPYISAIFLPTRARPGTRMLGREVWCVWASCPLPSATQGSVGYKGQGKDERLGTSERQLHGPLTGCSADGDKQGAVALGTSSTFTGLMHLVRQAQLHVTCQDMCQQLL